MNKAKYINKIHDRNGYAVHMFYEYRGHEYMVTDEHNGYSEPMSEKHRHEQERIDKLIEREAEMTGEYRNEAEEALNELMMFWEEGE